MKFIKDNYFLITKSFFIDKSIECKKCGSMRLIERENK